jgi:site-specific recombinase XerD
MTHFCHFGYRDDQVQGSSADDRRPAPISNEPESSASYEEAVLDCLMDRWQVTSPNAWSTIFAALAPGTLKSYKLIFVKFLQFMKEKDVNVNTVTIAQVFEFLEPLILAKRAASTLRSYVAALKFYLKLFQRLDLVQCPLFDLFSSGAQRNAPLPKSKTWIWDAGIPLRMIQDRPPPADFLSAAREALFLILMATGLRVGDAFLLGNDFSLSNGTFIIPFIGKRKRKIKGRWSTEQKISSYSGSERLCPGNALLLYATFSVTVRVPGEEALFISSTGRRAAKATLGGWVKDILFDAGISATAGSCRSAATSAAFLRKIPVDTILSSAGWSSDLTFFRHYQRDVGTSASGANLLPVVT